METSNITFDKDEHDWKRLIQAIQERRIIPVICPDMLVDESGENIQTVLLERISQSLELKCSSFTDLVNECTFKYRCRKISDGKSIVNQSVQAQWREISQSFTPRLLYDFLATKKFPFVITTSFLPIVETIMKEIYGPKNVAVKIFDNYTNSEAEIDNPDDLNKPTVYYMMGKSEVDYINYVLTDEDMLNFCSSWLNPKFRPDKLVSELSNRYLLVLGNNYSDWLFRFIWYSIKQTEFEKQDPTTGWYSSQMHDNALTSFLSRNAISLNQNPTETIMKILDYVRSENDGILPPSKDFVPSGLDIFISYSRRDKDFVKSLYEELTKQNINVWYDLGDSLCPGQDWREGLRSGVRHAKHFVPILTNHIKEEVGDPHIYRMEWKWGFDQKDAYFGMEDYHYFIPVIEENLEFESIGAGFFSDHNAITLVSPKEVADRIISTMNKKN